MYFATETAAFRKVRDFRYTFSTNSHIKFARIQIINEHPIVEFYTINETRKVYVHLKKKIVN